MLIDFQMPVMDGPTCVSRFRSYEEEHLLKSAAAGDGAGKGVEVGVRERERGRERETMGEGVGVGEGQEKVVILDPTLDLARSRPEPGLAPVARRLPIIGMSANSDDESRALGLVAGMDTFIAKPFTMKELQGVVARFYPPLPIEP